MIEKKTVSLYLNNMVEAFKRKIINKDWGGNDTFILLAADVFECVENINEIIQKEHSPVNESSKNDAESKKFEDETKKQIEYLRQSVEILSYKISKLQFWSSNSDEGIKNG